KGAMGIVYKGYDPMIERNVAIKTVLQNLLEGEEGHQALARFKREAQAAGRISHPNIVAVYEYGEDEGVSFIAMEYVEGKELKDCFDNNERFTPEKVVEIMKQLLSALEYAHKKGVVHRDIKPANILIMNDKDVKIMDFGVARIESSTLTQAGAVLGTPSYMSPEQFMGQTVDNRSDLFSAGGVLYQLLTGEKPFSGSLTTIMHRVLNVDPEKPSALNVQLPKSFDAVIVKALAKRPQDRYQTAADFSNALDKALAGEDDTDTAFDADATVVLGAKKADATIAVSKGTSVKKKSSKRLAIVGLIGVLLVVGTLAGVKKRRETARASIPDKISAPEHAEVLTASIPDVHEPVHKPEPVKPYEPPGFVMVMTEPNGAVVMLNDGERSFLGVTPKEIELSPGEYDFIIEKQGYHTEEASIEIESEARIPFKVKLMKIR
ncbi:MAG: serine/threonine protein kinase, partial [Alphaproteobacteria bacterium]|nr:serine/threonine protein kinase [Alphaproteobacteria bacterium]